MIINAIKFVRQHIVICLIHDKCGNLLVMTEGGGGRGGFGIQAKKLHLVLTFVFKSKRR